jgi:hypothetical protein
MSLDPTRLRAPTAASWADAVALRGRDENLDMRRGGRGRPIGRRLRHRTMVEAGIAMEAWRIFAAPGG